jgi:hypothetical protein
MSVALLSIALLIGLSAKAFFGWWWADPIAALVIAGLAAEEGVERSPSRIPVWWHWAWPRTSVAPLQKPVPGLHSGFERHCGL